MSLKDPNRVNPTHPKRRYSASDLITMGFIATPALAALVSQTRPAAEIDVARFDAIVIARGQAAMVTFAQETELHEKFVAFFEAGTVTAALCRGVAILRYARLSNGEYLARGRTVTGFSNDEEDYADNPVWSMDLAPKGTHVMPWRIEDEMRRMGANYIQAGPWRDFAIRDGNLITGQQNFSGKSTAEAVIAALGE